MSDPNTVSTTGRSLISSERPRLLESLIVEAGEIRLLTVIGLLILLVTACQIRGIVLLVRQRQITVTVPDLSAQRTVDSREGP